MLLWGGAGLFPSWTLMVCALHSLWHGTLADILPPTVAALSPSVCLSLGTLEGELVVVGPLPSPSLLPVASELHLQPWWVRGWVGEEALQQLCTLSLPSAPVWGFQSLMPSGTTLHTCTVRSLSLPLSSPLLRHPPLCRWTLCRLWRYPYCALLWQPVDVQSDSSAVT